MELIEAIKSRRSIRKFKPEPIPDEKIKELLDAARLAPSGTNLQPWRFVVVKSDEARAKLDKGTFLPFVAKAPVVLACCVDNLVFESMGQRVGELREAGAFLDTPLQDISTEDYASRRNQDEATARAYLALNAAIAIEHITLRAVDMGLGSCWVMMFDQEKVKSALELGDQYSVIALIPVGYPDLQPVPRPRLSLKEIIIKEL